MAVTLARVKTEEHASPWGGKTSDVGVLLTSSGTFVSRPWP